MANSYHAIAFTETVKAVQADKGSRHVYAKQETHADQNGRLTESEAAFIAVRDSVYMATTNETGWPYIQHRGGPRGFMRVLDAETLGFADFSGNRQYISLGNILKDDRVSLFFMDYGNRARLKLFGRAQPADPSDTDTLNRLTLPDYKARVERGIIIKVEAFDWNCPQHITPRLTEAEVIEAIKPLHQRIAALEAELAAAKA